MHECNVTAVEAPRPWVRELAMLVASLLCLLIPLHHAVAEAPSGERRIALVVGNSDYAAAPLKNPVNDARAMAKLLERLGFSVVLAENASRSKFVDAMDDFTARLDGAAVGVFYYAGHGLQIRDRNFLVPVDAKGGTEDAMIDGSIDAGRILDRMGAAGSRVNLLFLDACRDNPYAKTFRSEVKGLAPMDAKRSVRNTVIAFATAPGAVASDGRGDNGVYTKHLVRHLAEPGMPVEQALKRVRAGVIEETGQKQVPWESSSLVEDFYFAPPAGGQGNPPVVAGASTAVGAGGDAWQREQAFWENVKGSTDPLDYDAYLKAYPTGTFAGLARAKIEKYSKTTPAVTVATATSPAKAGPPEVSRNVTPADGGRPRLGDSWVYEVSLKGERQGTIGISVQDLGEERLTEAISSSRDKSFSAEREVRLGLNTDRFIETLLTLPGGLQLPEISPYILPGTEVEANDQWDKIGCEFTHTILGLRKFKCSMKVIGKESVRVPAGQFDAWKIEVNSEKIESKLMRFRVIYWYAPSMARSVKMEVGTVLMGGVSVPQVYELAAFKRSIK